MLGGICNGCSLKKTVSSMKIPYARFAGRSTKIFQIFDHAAGARGTPLPGGFSGLCGAPDKGPGRRLEETCCGRWTQGPPRRAEQSPPPTRLKSHPSFASRYTAPPKAEPAA